MNNMKKLEIQNNLLIVTDEEYQTSMIPLDDVVKLATIYDETEKAYLIELYFYHEQKVDGFACFPTIMFNGKMLHVLTQNYHESYCQDIQLIQDVEHDSFICISDKRVLSEKNQKELIYINFEFLDDVNNIGYELTSPKDSSIVCNMDLLLIILKLELTTFPLLFKNWTQSKTNPRKPQKLLSFWWNIWIMVRTLIKNFNVVLIK